MSCQPSFYVFFTDRSSRQKDQPPVVPRPRRIVIVRRKEEDLHSAPDPFLSPSPDGNDDNGSHDGDVSDTEVAPNVPSDDAVSIFLTRLDLSPNAQFTAMCVALITLRDDAAYDDNPLPAVRVLDDACGNQDTMFDAVHFLGKKVAKRLGGGDVMGMGGFLEAIDELRRKRVILYEHGGSVELSVTRFPAWAVLRHPWVASEATGDYMQRAAAGMVWEYLA